MKPEVLQAFAIKGNPLSCERYGNGHINDTYLLRTDAPFEYILQRINHQVFTDIPALMRNIALVTAHLAKKDADPRHVMSIIPTKTGESYACFDGMYYRVYRYIMGNLSLDRPENEEDFAQSGVAFGRFQQMLSDFPADTLTETIPDFHDTPVRYDQLRAAVKSDPVNRLHTVAAEVDFAMSRDKEAAMLTRLLRAGELPLRVTHNDTKFNNVLLDRKTRKPLCVIDLDTVMPGLVANDFGDSIRFGASTAAEDERDLSKVTLSLSMYHAYAKGFLSACGDSLLPAEIKSLPLGAKLMTLECGVRFLTDYLRGDTYFRVHRPGHNLDRCRAQFKLVADMEDKYAQMGVW